MAYIARRVIPDGTVVECQWPAIVPEEMFWRVQAIRAAVPQAAALKGRPKSTYRSLLGGLGSCGRCGAKVSMHSSEQKKRGKIRRYRCAGSFCFKLDHISDVDERVGWEVVKYLLTPGVLERHLPTGGRGGSGGGTRRGRCAARRAGRVGCRPGGVPRRVPGQGSEAHAADRGGRGTRPPAQHPPGRPGFADRLGFEDGDPDTATADRLNAAMQVWDDMPMEAARALLREVADVVIYPQALARELGKDQVEVLFKEAAA
jgi:hypothetical protein